MRLLEMVNHMMLYSPTHRAFLSCNRRVKLAGLAFVLALAPASPGHAVAGENSSLVCAARRGRTDEVLSLLRAGADVDSRDTQGRTALLRATTAGRRDVVKILISAEADVDAADRNGLTPLFEAVRLGHIEAARDLLEAGADPDPRYREIGTPLDVAERQGDRDLSALLRSHGARGSGKSTGDVVCVRPWDGEGYCGTVTAVEISHWMLRVTKIVGCLKGCTPGDCSMGRPVGGDQADRVRIGDEVRVEGACLTHTGLGSEEQRTRQP
ncbi:MAG: ankyrin repeat domain-containing protein [Vicinamibacteria bacterium]|nr:ankyrin repeat domain-containing protein [Vicinamibacteria bacterium]